MRTIGVVREQAANETRVALVPEVVAALLKGKDCTIMVEQNAGLRAGFADEDYLKAGAAMAPRAEVIARSQQVVALNGGEFFAESDVKNKVLIGSSNSLFSRRPNQALKRPTSYANLAP